MAAGFKEKLRNVSRNFGDGLSPYLPDYFPVAWKLGLSISGLIIVGMAVLGSIVLNSQLERMQTQADRFGATIALQLADTAREPLLADDGFNLKVLLNNLVRSDTLRGAALFDRDGNLSQIVGESPERVLITTDSRLMRWDGADGPLSTYFVPIAINDMTAGYAAVTLSGKRIIEARQNAQDTIVTATILMSLIAIVVAFVVSRKLSAPIHQLLTAASAISAGDLNYRIDDRRNDEIGLLINAYNSMAHGLLEKGQVEKVLSRFVSPTVARKMMADLDQISLGGREVEGSVIFADIVGFTRLSENMAPDAVAEMLNGYFDAISMAATFYRGTIDKYMGDCAMIVFGVPEDDDEHEYHSMCCGVMIQRMIQRLNLYRASRGLTTVEFRIGINSGSMLAGNLGSRDRMQYTVVGDAVNLASRLSNMSGSGEVIVPQALAVQPNISSRIRARQSGAMRVRGKSEPIMTYIVDGVHAQSETLMEQRIAQFLNELMEEPLRIRNA
ncbi:MAG: adenylate/guanylate cyclase domain-containing protein [Alcanivoracaceae bacterium]|nr:adenylate/guanylate cyclase domain-containing protein [Alcanivoracaceae bacterium]